MKRLLLGFSALLLSVIYALPQSIEGGTGPVITPGYEGTTAGGGAPPAYSGPGDVVAGATAWWGLRAYTAALANAGASTTPVIDVLGSSTATGCTIYLKGDGTGGLDLTTAGPGVVGHQCLLGATTFCTVTNPSCTVSNFYDQSGALNCSSAACDVSEATAGNEPTLQFSGCSSGSLPCLTFVGSSAQTLHNVNSLNSNQPITVTTVAINTDSGTGGFSFFVNESNNFFQFNNGAANLADVFCGNLLTAVANDNNWWALGIICNGVSGAIYVNGSGTTGDAGSNNMSGRPQIGGFFIGSSSYFTGSLNEVGMWGGVAFNGTQASNMSANQRAYWGF